MNGKKLYRSRTDRKIAGVCGGLATYFNVDSTVVRIGMIILALPGGPSILIYFVLWLVMPEEPVAK
ncbi:MAG: PspC domain-containing protein [Candidatus Saccharimonadales bacterium]|jgi:phage shock protein C